MPPPVEHTFHGVACPFGAAVVLCGEGVSAELVGGLRQILPARTAVLLRELRRELNATLAELFERPPASSGLSDHTTSAIDVVARLLQEEPTRAIVGE